jgi:hypothetical protein
VTAVFDGKFQNSVHLETQYDLQFQVRLSIDQENKLVKMAMEHWDQNKSNSADYMASFKFKHGGIL